jgi:hypothetical protein
MKMFRRATVSSPVAMCIAIGRRERRGAKELTASPGVWKWIDGARGRELLRLYEAL